MIVAQYFHGLFGLSRRFLTCLQYPNGPLIAQILQTMIHVPVCILFVDTWNCGIQGIGYASSVTFFLKYVFIVIYSNCITDIK